MFLWNIAVTSLVEVWIEITAGKFLMERTQTSLPLWKCGLKLQYEYLIQIEMPSLPLWKCGLKLRFDLLFLSLQIRHFPCGSVD